MVVDLCELNDCPSSSCPARQYFDEKNGSCAVCPDGYICNGKPTLCPQGKYCNGGTAEPCETSMFCSGLGFFKSPSNENYLSICWQKDVGNCHSRACKDKEVKYERVIVDGLEFAKCACDESYYFDESRGLCLPCSPGYTCVGQAQQPKLCDVGYYCIGGLAKKCKSGDCPYKGMVIEKKQIGSKYYASICNRYVSPNEESIQSQSQDRNREACNAPATAKSLFKCDKNMYRNDGICRFCKPGYYCEGGGHWNSTNNYFEDTPPVLCPEGYWCGDQAWANRSPPGLPPGQQWKNSCIEDPCLSKGSYRKSSRTSASILKRGKSVLDFDSVCCSDIRHRIKRISCLDANAADIKCPVICSEGKYADKNGACTGESSFSYFSFPQLSFVMFNQRMPLSFLPS